MSDLVRARVNGFEKNISRALAESTEGIEILDQPTHRDDGTPRATTRTGGRRIKRRTTVAKEAAAKKAAAPAADTAEEAPE